MRLGRDGTFVAIFLVKLSRKVISDAPVNFFAILF